MPSPLVDDKPTLDTRRQSHCPVEHNRIYNPSTPKREEVATAPQEEGSPPPPP
ncbi:hypothetical protein OF83DRAFT_1180933 [Amylostereum chailletii]|nr:hypothetical protein OF83DRAFT_1180933 [Amylostereum chailletii]